MRLVLAGLAVLTLFSLGASALLGGSSEPEMPRPPRAVAPTPPPDSVQGAEPPTPGTPPLQAGRRLPGRPAPRADAAPPLSAGARASREALVRAYGAQYLNWNDRTIARQFRRLATLSAGRLRRAHRVAARHEEANATLASDKAGMRGRITALEPDGPGFEVTTRQRYYGARGGEVRTAVSGRYAVQVARRPDGTWRVTAWEPVG
jgi:hypothetical protein